MQARRHEFVHDMFMTTLATLPDLHDNPFLLSFRSLPDPNSNTLSWWKSSLWQAHHPDIRMPPSHKCLGKPATNSELQVHHKSKQNITITYRPWHRIWVYGQRFSPVFSVQACRIKLRGRGRVDGICHEVTLVTLLTSVHFKAVSLQRDVW